MAEPGPCLVSALLVAAALAAGCFGAGGADVEALRAADPTVPCGDLPDWTVDERYDPRIVVRTSKGAIEAVVYVEQLPLTGGNLRDFVASGTYNGTRFHRVVPDFAVYGGDPLTKDLSRRPQWGYASTRFLAPDEFHAFLRYDTPGVMGMATAGPNTVGSMWFVTTRATPGLDDRQPVVGRVVSGMDTVEAIAATPVWREGETPPGEEYRVGQPREDVSVFGVDILPPSLDRNDAPASIHAAGVDCVQTVTPGEAVPFLVAVRNGGQRSATVSWALEAPPGWSAELGWRDRVFGVPSGQTVLLAFNVTAPATLGEDTGVTIRFDELGGAATRIGLTVRPGEARRGPMAGETVLVDYVGLLEDGRVFDASEPAAFEGVLDVVRVRDEGLTPLTCRIAAAGVECLSNGADGAEYAPIIRGFGEAIEGSVLERAVVARVPPSRGFGATEYGPSGLGGRNLYYEVVLRRIEP